MACDRVVTDALLFDCADRPKKGISNARAVIVNFDDIDRAASTEAGATVTSLVLKTGAIGYPVQWYKDLASASGEFVPNAEDLEGFKHSWLARLANSSAANAERAVELAGGKFIMVYETKYKGTDSLDAFKIAGWEEGLELEAMRNATNEQSGSTPYTLATEADAYETYPYNVLLETDYATTLAEFDALFDPTP